MSRISSTFERLRVREEKALVTFITAGDPDVGATVPAMHEMAKSGTDILELGVPFTDPEADGPSIQRSSERGLEQGVTLTKTCELVAAFREKNAETPVVLMGYYNPILAIGIERFAKLAANCGLDGLIVVNLPPESAEVLHTALRRVDIDLIFLIAPTTPESRLEAIIEQAQGFLYYVSIKGVTGAHHLNVADVAAHVKRIKNKTTLPVAVGFGIKTPAAAKQVAKIADAVVVGSALVDVMGQQQALEMTLTELANIASQLKLAIRSD